jgi:signal transduction histidine kinase
MTKEMRTTVFTSVVAVAAAGVGALTFFVGPALPPTSALWLLPTMVALVALAGRFPFKVSPQGDASLFTVPLFMSVLMLPPFGAVLAGALGSLISERLLRAPAKVTAFNVSNSAIAGGVAGIVFYMLRPDAIGLALTPGLALAAAAAGLVLHVTNLSILFGIMTMVKGLAFWQTWRSAWALDAVQEAALIALGLAGALVAAQAGWGLLLLLVPFVLGYYGFKRSVEVASEKAELAEELQLKLKELKESQAQLIQSAKLASVGTLAAGVAHEINNPAFAITGRAEMFTEMLRRTNDEYLHSAQAQKDMEVIFREGMRISSIVRHLLDFARRSDDVKEVYLDGVMDDTVELLGGKISTKGIKIAREYEVSPRVKAVPTQLQQVFMNLLSNAIDATPSWGTITLRCTVRDGMATACIKDTGVGIPEDIRQRLFEPFFTTKGVGKGTGLGLFICHKIVTEHQGDILVESEQGKGTTMTVKLPLVGVASQSQALRMVSAAGA